MKRYLLIAVLAIAAMCWIAPSESHACGLFRGRLRAVVRAPLRIASAPVRLVRTIRHRRCRLRHSYYHAPRRSCQTGACPAR